MKKKGRGFGSVLALSYLKSKLRKHPRSLLSCRKIRKGPISYLHCFIRESESRDTKEHEMIEQVMSTISQRNIGDESAPLRKTPNVVRVRSYRRGTL